MCYGSLANVSLFVRYGFVLRENFDANGSALDEALLGLPSRPWSELQRELLQAAAYNLEAPATAITPGGLPQLMSLLRVITSDDADAAALEKMALTDAHGLTRVVSPQNELRVLSVLFRIAAAEVGPAQGPDAWGQTVELVLAELKGQGMESMDSMDSMEVPAGTEDADSSKRRVRAEAAVRAERRAAAAFCFLAAGARAALGLSRAERAAAIALLEALAVPTLRQAGASAALAQYIRSLP